MKLFIHTNNDLKYKVAEVNHNQKIGFLVKEFTPQLVSNKDFLEDVEIYLKDTDEDFDKGHSFNEAGIMEGNHLFVGRCKKIAVTINYAGKEYSLSVPPSISAKVLREKALKYFNISDDDGVDLLLWLNKNTYLEDRNLIGSTTDYPKCSAELILASKEDIQGSPEEEVMKDHLSYPEYLAGEMDNCWSTYFNNEGPSWPFIIFWVISKKENRYFFRFDITGYNRLAPTAILWDHILNQPLKQSKWPDWNKRCRQVFRVWGKQCLYLPCDRLAFEGHPDWSSKHSYLIWKEYEDTIVKYLTELYQILNF